MTSLSNSSLFKLSSGANWVNPVTFPPGRAKLVTNPAPTGSLTLAKTIGIVLVVFLAARAGSVEFVTITSTLSWTSSAARSASRLRAFVKMRYSTAIFCPSR